MKVLFPKILDHFGLNRTREQKNSAETETGFKSEDIPFVLKELEQKVGINESRESTSHDYRIAQLETQVAAQQETIAAISGITLDGGYVVVSAAGEVTVPLNKVAPTDKYFIVTRLVDANQALLNSIPKIAPTHTETRTTLEFKVDCADIGTLFWEIKA